MFGEPMEVCALDSIVRMMVEQHRLFWRERILAEWERPAFYNLRHKTGIAVWLIARGKI